MKSAQLILIRPSIFNPSCEPCCCVLHLPYTVVHPLHWLRLVKSKNCVIADRYSAGCSSLTESPVAAEAPDLGQYEPCLHFTQCLVSHGASAVIETLCSVKTSALIVSLQWLLTVYTLSVAVNVDVNDEWVWLPVKHGINHWCFNSFAHPFNLTEDAAKAEEKEKAAGPIQEVSNEPFEWDDVYTGDTDTQWTVWLFAVAQLDNDITVKPLPPVAMEQVVELSIVLTREMYSENLDDPGSLQYQTLSRQLADKVRRLHSFGKMCCVSPNKALRFLIASDFGLSVGCKSLALKEKKRLAWHIWVLLLWYFQGCTSPLRHSSSIFM